MIGKTVSHYKILEKPGEGGMGVVYKAEDTKLQRTVALKFLPERLTVSDTEKARFLQEAKAAALNHPNVCVIYEIQEDAETQFIVMEFVDGKTLRDIIASYHAHPLSTDQAISYAIQIAEALQEAHSKEIVHRDIKSENIMVNAKNQIKVMHFGLAKLKGSLKLTQTASTVGTLAYMAPEQIESKAVDARSDIFSLGVVLYESLTCQLPFKGDYEASLMYSVLNEEPESLQKHLPDASSELIHVVNRALEKEPDERYQNVYWLDEQTLLVLDLPKRTSFRVPVNGGEPLPLYQDSTVAVPIRTGEYLLFRDHRRGRRGFYTIPMADVRAKRYDAAKKVADYEVTYWSVPPGGLFLLAYQQPGEVWKISLPDGKREKLGGVFRNPNVDPGSVNFSYDGKEVVYATESIRGKLVLIEDFAK